MAKPCPEPPGSLFPREETRELPGAMAELSPSRDVSLFAGLSVTNARLASGIFTSPLRLSQGLQHFSIHWKSGTKSKSPEWGTPSMFTAILPIHPSPKAPPGFPRKPRACALCKGAGGCPAGAVVKVSGPLNPAQTLCEKGERSRGWGDVQPPPQPLLRAVGWKLPPSSAWHSGTLVLKHWWRRGCKCL